MAEQPRITVVGIGVAHGTPDQCRLQIALNCMTASAGDALSTAADKAALAMAALDALEVEQRDVRTVGLSVQGYFDHTTQQVTAHIGSYQMDITVRPVAVVGPVLGALAQAVGDALAVRGIQLSVDDPEPLKSEARRLAVQDARKRALELCHEAGVGLGPLESMQDGNAATGPGYQPMRAMTMSAGGAGLHLPIEGGEVSTVSAVTMTFALEPRAVEPAPG